MNGNGPNDCDPSLKQHGAANEGRATEQASAIRGDQAEASRIPGFRGRRAFDLQLPDPAPIPVLISVPHAGRCYPPELLARMRYPEQTPLRLEDRYVDLVARALARETGAALLIAHAPRAMIDLNRAPEDMDWNMVAGGEAGALASGARALLGRRARSGLGLVPRRLPGMGELWTRRMSATDLAARIGSVHRPYHAALAETLDHLHERWGTALLIDLHSMPPLGPKTGEEAAPDFVLGDRFGTACGAGISTSIMEHFAASGRGAAYNQPYAGGYVLDRHSAPMRGIHAVQLELCRAAYLDRGLREPGPGLAGIVGVLAALVGRLADELMGSAALVQAAE